MLTLEGCVTSKECSDAQVCFDAMSYKICSCAAEVALLVLKVLLRLSPPFSKSIQHAVLEAHASRKQKLA